jgi:hypothetical protein
VVCSILFLKARGLGRTWQLPLLSYRHKARSNPQRETRAEEEASSVKTDDNVGLVVDTVRFQDVELEGADEAFMQRGILSRNEAYALQRASRGDLP